MFISDQMLQTQMEFIRAEYKELESLVQLHASDVADQIATSINAQRMELDCLRETGVSGEMTAQERTILAKRMRAEARSLKRQWARHLVTTARNRQHIGRRQRRSMPTFAV